MERASTSQARHQLQAIRRVQRTAHSAATAEEGAIPQYPGAVDPLQLDDLLPDGKQGKQLKDSYTVDEEHGWTYGNHPDTNAEQQQLLKQMLIRNKAAFSYSLKDLPGYTGDKVHIELVHNNPIITPRRRYSALEEGIINEKGSELLEANLIEPADPFNPYACCPTLPAKKDIHGNFTDRRFCVDLRPVNAATKPMRYYIPLPEVLFQRVEGYKYFTALDLRAAFNQLPLDDHSKKVCSWYWGASLFSYRVMPFGLKNASAIFQSVMDKVLGEAGLSQHAWAFVDDVLVASPDYESHLEHVERTLHALHAVGLRVHPQKSVFCADRVTSH